MAGKFSLNISRSSDSLHLFPKGKLDGSSASILAHMLDEYCNGSERIVVHTGGLTEVHPFGVAVFQGHLPRIQKGNVRVVFTGEHCNRLASV